jgi:hypothetical protein
MEKVKSLSEQQVVLLSKVLSVQAQGKGQKEKKTKGKVEVDFSYQVSSDAGTT